MLTHSVEGVSVAIGLKEAPTQKGEVVGHMSPFPGAWYYCFNGHGPWWVQGGCNYFVCPVDHGFNSI